MGMRARSQLMLSVCLAGSLACADQLLVASNAVWRYLDTGTNAGTAWRAPAYDDSAWPQGPAQLGYGDGDEATVVGYGTNTNNRYVTSYFRRAFHVPNPAAFTTLRLRLLRDDGAVVYLNGTEIRRDNMPAGAITYTTLASTALGTPAEATWYESSLAATNLLAGTNVLAVEIHQANVTSTDISFGLALSGASVGLRKGPYLIYPGTNTQMRVLWQTDATPIDRAYVEWGPTLAYGNRSDDLMENGGGADEHQFTYLLTGLTPGTLCQYRVIVDTCTNTGAFVTAPPDDARTLTCYGFGDTRTYPDKMDAVLAAMERDMQQDPLRRQTFALHVGDWVQYGGTEASWQDEFFNRAYSNTLTTMASLPIMGCRGNHDDDGGPTLMSKYWPFNDDKGSFAFDYGPLFVVVVDQYVPYTVGSVQYGWLSNCLAATPKPFKIVVFHEPAFSAGGGHVNNTTAQSDLVPLLTRFGVQVALVGHNHYYAHCLTGGVHHVTSGGGGAPLATPDLAATALVLAESAYQFVRFDISNAVLTVTAVRTDDSVIETFQAGATAPWDLWLSSRFLADQVTNSAAVDPLADPDGDRHVNLREYAFDSDPRDSNSTPRGAAVTLTPGVGNPSVLFTYPRRKAPRDIDYVEEVSGDLQVWTNGRTATWQVTDDSNGVTETVRSRIVPPYDATSPSYFRVRIDKP